MTPRLSGHFSIFSLVFFVLKSFWVLRATGVVKILLFFPISLGAMLEFQYIERGLLVFSANWVLPCDESIKKGDF